MLGFHILGLSSVPTLISDNPKADVAHDFDFGLYRSPHCLSCVGSVMARAQSLNELYVRLWLDKARLVSNFV